MSSVVYLYGFVPAESVAPEALAGIDDAAVELLAAGPVAAVISTLDGARWSAAAIERQLQELPWAAQQGVAHERVVAWFVDHGTILPAPLFTLYSSRDAVITDSTARGAGLRAQLEHFAGVREWDVKIGYDPAQLAANAASVSASVRALDEDIAAAAPGRRFLLERKRGDLLKTEVAQAARAVADAILDRLQSHARETVRLALPRAEVALPVVVNAALLVPNVNEAAVIEALEREAAEFEPLGVHVRFSGPWAPYRFIGEVTADA